MSQGYGQYCPLALSTEIFGERWTILILSRLFDGCCHFNEIHRGLPRISATLLSNRLKTLENAAIIRKLGKENQHGTEYQLTAAGRELEPMIELLAAWGQRWARDMNPDDLDIRFLAWSMHTRTDPSAMPPGRTVVEFRLQDNEGDNCSFWLLNETDHVVMCLKDPDLDVDLLVRAELQRFVETWRGFRSLKQELATGRIKLDGPSEFRNAFPKWLLLSSLADVKRQKSGRELNISRRSGRQR